MFDLGAHVLFGFLCFCVFYMRVFKKREKIQNDVKYKERLKNLNVLTWLIVRYMDDGRLFMPPFKHGWRWHEGYLVLP